MAGIFSNIMDVLEKMEDKDPLFRSGSSYNERNYYNLLLHYGKKNKKRHSEKMIFYLYMF